LSEAATTGGFNSVFLSVLMGELCDLFTYPLPKPEACEYIWLLDFYELKVGMLA